MNNEIRLSEFGIKDMNLTEQAEEDEQEENTTPSEPTKTWNLPTMQQQDENRAPASTKITSTVTNTAYVPAHARRLGGNAPTTATPDINNVSQFPSLADAETIDKNQRDVEKRQEYVFEFVAIFKYFQKTSSRTTVVGEGRSNNADDEST